MKPREFINLVPFDVWVKLEHPRVYLNTHPVRWCYFTELWYNIIEENYFLNDQFLIILNDDETAFKKIKRPKNYIK